ncbi:hypothetical protein [uncultured Halomonas sp.]|uniref:hypothetical protein n=1 Tax=uncultured Halomonas sp. TaxID=173971 RepID=UPI0026301B3C|nr:hypothetical protein [uncultured Halomonas sp.]
MNVIYRIDRPYDSGRIEVYGDEPYEWRILDHSDQVVRDSATDDSSAGGYSAAELALRDAIAFDADDNVVPIFFGHSADAERENAAQAQRTAESLQALAGALKSAASQARLDSRHATDDDAQDYLDARIEAMDRVVEELEESVGRLKTLAETEA